MSYLVLEHVRVLFGGAVVVRKGERVYLDTLWTEAKRASLGAVRDRSEGRFKKTSKGWRLFQKPREDGIEVAKIKKTSRPLPSWYRSGYYK